MPQDGELIATGGSVLIGALEPEARDALISLARRVSYPQGATIYTYGEPGETMFIIESGRVEVSLTSKSGRKSVLNMMGPGEALGEVAMLDRRPRSADAVAAEEVAGLLLHRSEIMAFLQKNPGAMFALMSELCAKVRNASELFAAQSNTHAPARLARCLLRLGAKWGEATKDGGISVGVPFSQRDLGEFSGLARENVNRQIRKWVEAGLMTFSGEGFVLLRPAHFEELAGL